MHEDRKRAIERFQEKINDTMTTERQWERFFEQNEWIFGHGLDYRYLSKLQGQVYIGGTEMDRSGGVRGDYLMATKAMVGQAKHL